MEQTTHKELFELLERFVYTYGYIELHRFLKELTQKDSLFLKKIGKTESPLLYTIIL